MSAAVGPAPADPAFRHAVPGDLAALLERDADLAARWATLTALQKSDWVCWLITVKRQATREAHLVRLAQDIASGKRSPCCWPGCPHRRASARKWITP